LYGEVNGVDYYFAIFGVLSHVVNATCYYIALVRCMLKNVIDVGESSTDLEEIGKLVKEATETGNICDVKELQWQQSRGD